MLLHKKLQIPTIKPFKSIKFTKKKSTTTLFIVGNAGYLCVGNVSGSDWTKPSSSLEITRFICSESRTVYVEYIQFKHNKCKRAHMISQIPEKCKPAFLELSTQN